MSPNKEDFFDVMLNAEAAELEREHNEAFGRSFLDHLASQGAAKQQRNAAHLEQLTKREPAEPREQD